MLKTWKNTLKWRLSGHARRCHFTACFQSAEGPSTSQWATCRWNYVRVETRYGDGVWMYQCLRRVIRRARGGLPDRYFTCPLNYHKEQRFRCSGSLRPALAGNDHGHLAMSEEARYEARKRDFGICHKQLDSLHRHVCRRRRVDTVADSLIEA